MTSQKCVPPRANLPARRRTPASGGENVQCYHPHLVTPGPPPKEPLTELSEFINFNLSGIGDTPALVQPPPPDPDLPTCPEESLKTRNAFISEDRVCANILRRLKNPNQPHLKEEDPIKEDYRKKDAGLQSRIDKLYEDTAEAVVRKDAASSSSEKFAFNYFQFQRDISGFHQEHLDSFLLESITTNSTKPPDYPDIHQIKKHFQRFYGTVDENAIYLQNFTGAIQEKGMEICEKQNLYKKVVQKFGMDVAQQAFNYYQRTHHQPENSSCFNNLTDKQRTYDLNPLSNQAHFEWFRLDRKEPDLTAYCIQHQETQKFAESQILLKDFHLIHGLWPSITDYGVTEPLNISSDPCLVLTPAVTLAKTVDRHVRQMLWEDLYRNMNDEIVNQPLGITLDRFFLLLKKKYGYRDGVKHFGEVSNLDAAKSLPDMFYVAELPLHDKKEVIVFPGYLEGVVAAPWEIIRKVWRRITFLVAFLGGQVRIQDVEALYQSRFACPISFKNWGFNSTQEFVEYCQEQYDKLDGRHIEIVEPSKLVGVHLVYLDKVKDDDDTEDKVSE